MNFYIVQKRRVPSRQNKIFCYKFHKKLFLFDWIKRNLQFNEKANLFKKYEKKNSSTYLFPIKNYTNFIIEIIEKLGLLITFMNEAHKPIKSCAFFVISNVFYSCTKYDQFCQISGQRNKNGK